MDHRCHYFSFFFHSFLEDETAMYTILFRMPFNLSFFQIYFFKEWVDLDQLNITITYWFEIKLNI